MKQNEPVTAEVSLRNYSPTTQKLGWATISVRDSGGRNFDFPIQQYSIGPWSTLVIRQTRTLPASSGPYTARLVLNHPWFGWTTAYPQRQSPTIPDTASFTTTDSISVGQLQFSQPTTATSPTTATATFTNTSTQPLYLGWVIASARSNTGANLDFPPKQVTVPANGTAIYTSTRLLPAGTHSAFLTLNTPFIGWSTSFPAGASASATTITVVP
jgi:hypothetical protein